MRRATVTQSVVCAALVALVACGRADALKADGREGGACFANDTCFAPLLCSASHICVQPGCAGDSCETPCPADMVLVGEGLCVDRYEATLFADPSCTGVRYGDGRDDIPSSFPDRVSSENCTSPCAGQSTEAAIIDLYACSVPHLVPTAFITWFQAKRACENVNKRLCSEGQWYLGCAGPSGNVCAAGDSCAGKCNGWNTGPGVVLPTGAMSTCEGGVTGLFDMSGNLKELTLSCASGVCVARGGSFTSIDAEVTCVSVDDEGPTDSHNNVGFRCCSSLP